ncbi:MAG: hypothetical protein FGM26_09735 [Beijerinckiaceae bacterium]|nr:hypothetical protein [Beijerinckiaceae bacterium]
MDGDHRERREPVFGRDNARPDDLRLTRDDRPGYVGPQDRSKPGRDGRQRDRIEPHFAPRIVPERDRSQAVPQEPLLPLIAEEQPVKKAKASKTETPKAKTAKRRRRRRSLLGFFAYWTLVLGVWGFIGLGALFAYHASKLPPIDQLAIPKRPPDVAILAADGTLIANRGETGGRNVSLSELPPYLPKAFIAIEDHRFYDHMGIDPIGIQRIEAMPQTLRQAIDHAQALVRQIDSMHLSGQLTDWSACRAAGSSFAQQQTHALAALRTDLQLLRTQPDIPAMASERRHTLAMLGNALRAQPAQSGWRLLATQHPDAAVRALVDARGNARVQITLGTFPPAPAVMPPVDSGVGAVVTAGSAMRGEALAGGQQSRPADAVRVYGKVSVPLRHEARIRHQQAAFDAAAVGDLERLHGFLEAGLDPAVRDANSNTLLHVAAANGHDAVVRFLAVTQGLPLEVFDENQLTPLLRALTTIVVQRLRCWSMPGRRWSTGCMTSVKGIGGLAKRPGFCVRRVWVMSVR